MTRSYRWREKGTKLNYMHQGQVKNYSLLLDINSKGKFIGQMVDGGIITLI